MQKEERVTKLPLTILIAASTLFSGVMAIGSAKAQSTVSPEVEGWVVAHYDEVVRQLLPDTPKGVGGYDNFPRDMEWVIAVRVFDSYRPGEYWFSILKQYTGPIAATVRIPIGKPIFTQLEELRENDPTADLESLKAKIQTREYNWTSEQVPKLKNLVNEFESTKIPAQMSDAIRSDPVVYHFWTMSRAGEKMEATLYGPEPRPARQVHPLIQFVEDFRKLMDKQIQNDNKNAVAENLVLSPARRIRLDGDLHLTIRPAALESAATVP